MGINRYSKWSNKRIEIYIKTMQIAVRYYSYLILPFLLSGCSNKPIHNSTWNSNEIIIDGIFSDWEKDLTYDKKSKLLYNVTNDHTNLLLCLKVTEPSVTNKIMMRGLTVWVDTTGKQKKNLGIKYPMGRSGSMRPADQRTPRQPMPEQQRERPVRPQIQNRMELIGFKERGKSEVVPVGDTTGIEIAVKEDPYGGMQYEAKIPLQVILKDPDEFLSATETLISVGFETGYIKMDSNTGGGQTGGRVGGGGGGRPSGGGGRPTGGGQPGGMTPQQGDMANMTQATRLWIKQIKLVISE